MQVEVYRNLHKKCFSVRDRATRKVVDHKQHVLLENVTFRVSLFGRQRVLREKRKNVHAFVRGSLCEKIEFPTLNPREAYYNPYKVEKFTDLETGKAVEKASRVFLTTGHIYYWE